MHPAACLAETRSELSRLPLQQGDLPLGLRNHRSLEREPSPVLALHVDAPLLHVPANRHFVRGDGRSAVAQEELRDVEADASRADDRDLLADDFVCFGTSMYDNTLGWSMPGMPGVRGLTPVAIITLSKPPALTKLASTRVPSFTSRQRQP